MAIARVEASDVENAAEAALENCEHAVLAVSGGLDSMVLLTSAARLPARKRRNLMVATFDHGTGKAAGRAAALVARYSSQCGFLCVTGRASTVGSKEEEWRRGRWEFLRQVASKRTPASSPRTRSTIRSRPSSCAFSAKRDHADSLDSTLNRKSFARSSRQRAVLVGGARALRVPFVQDPSNRDRKHLRNRIRLDILPSIVKRNPGFPDELLAIAHEAASWRRSLEDLAGSVETESQRDGALRISRSSLAGYDDDSLRVLWPALAARASVVMDRRGTHRAAQFTIRGATGGTIQLSGGVEIVMRRDHMLLRRWRSEASESLA